MIRCAGHMAIVRGKKGVHTRFWWRNLKAKSPMKDVGANGKIILKLVLKK
jgi:hypothetical protein